MSILKTLNLLLWSILILNLIGLFEITQFVVMWIALSAIMAAIYSICDERGKLENNFILDILLTFPVYIMIGYVAGTAFFNLVLKICGV